MSAESTIYAWGSDEEGQLGLGKNRVSQFYTSIKICHYKLQFSQVSCGKFHSALIATNGQLYTMGTFAVGSQKVHSSAPQRMECFSKHKITQVSCGDSHTGCVTNEGLAFTWGDNQYGQLGCQGKEQPCKLQVQDLKAISCGNYHTVCLNKMGEGFAFGLGDQGQLGAGKIKSSWEPLKLKVSQLKQVVAAHYFSLFLGNEGSVYGCGEKFGSYPQKLNYKQKFTKIDGKLFGAGLTISNELIFFESDESLKGVRDFSLGESVGLAIGERCYQWSFDRKGLSQPKMVEQLSGKSLVSVSAGAAHFLCIGNGSGESLSHASSTATIRNKTSEERSRSQYSQNDQPRIEKLLEEKDLKIAQLSRENGELTRKWKESEALLEKKDQEIAQLKAQVKSLKQENHLLAMKRSEHQVLECEVEEVDSLSSSPKRGETSQSRALGPVREQQLATRNTEEEMRQKSFEKIRLRSEAGQQQENRTQSQARGGGDEKANLSTIKSRLSDLQRNKEQLEQRMKQFESRLRENKIYQK